MSDITAEEVMGQALVAFGQGTGAVWVHHEAVRALRTLYAGYVGRALQYWDEDAGQALERVRATGRLAALLAIQAGRMAITEHDFTTAAGMVREVNRDAQGNITRICTG
jgi:hypothetical protein